MMRLTIGKFGWGVIDIRRYRTRIAIPLCRAAIWQPGRTERLAAFSQCHCDDRIIPVAWGRDAVVDREALNLLSGYGR